MSSDGEFSWEGYCRWTDEVVYAKNRDQAELIEIWGLGLGGELCEFLEPAMEREALRPGMAEVLDGPDLRRETLTELGDLLYYVARLYVDTSNVRRVVLGPKHASLGWLVRKVGLTIECVKKALRKDGRAGIDRLGMSYSGQAHIGSSLLPGRREEFRELLDHATTAIEGWLIDQGSSLREVCELNQKKLMQRKLIGAIADRPKPDEGSK